MHMKTLLKIGASIRNKFLILLERMLYYANGAEQKIIKVQVLI